jgi:guanine nucleotide-binding protein subunit alpha
MGNCFSTESDEDRVSARIDKEIGEDMRRLRRECKILLLGNGSYLSLQPHDVVF